MKSGANFFRPYDVLTVALAFIMVLLYTAVAGQGFPLDDSWIHQSYGRNLAQAGEWAFIAGIPSAASTSPLYTVILSVGYALGVDHFLWTHGIGALALAAAGVLASRLAERIPTGWKYTAPLTGIVTVTAWHLVWAATSGMETMLFAAFTLLLILLAWRETSADVTHVARRGAIFGAATALTVSLRPEGALLAGLLGLTVLLLHGRTGLRWAVGAAAAFAICIAPYLLLNLSLTGGLLPNTSAAKQAEYRPLLTEMGVPLIFLNFFGAVIAGGQTALLPGAAFYAARISPRVPRAHLALYLVPLVWFFALLLIYSALLPLYKQHGRYVIPALPALLVIGVCGTVMLIRTLSRQRIGRIFAAVLAISAAAISLTFSLVLGPITLRQDVSLINEEMVAAAHWLNANLPPESGLLALHDIGAVGYFAPRPMLDTAGLVTPDIIPLLGDSDAMWAFMESHNAAYALFLPDQIPSGDTRDPRLCHLYSRPGTTRHMHVMSLYRIQWNGSCPAE